MDITIWQLPKDEDEAIKFFQDKELIHRQRLCSNNHNMVFCYKDKTISPKWKCHKVSCTETKGMRTQTWFFGSRIPFLTASRFIYFWCLDLTSIEFCELQLEMNHNTVVDWNSYMRTICANALMSRVNVKIGGCDKTIQINMCMIKLERTKHSSQRLVLGGMCQETKECFAVAVPDCSAKTFLGAIEENVNDGSTISSDFWKGYATGELEDADYENYKAKHGFIFVENGSEDQSWRTKRRRINGQHYLLSNWMEFMWRCIHPKTERFSAILRDIHNFMPPT